jgi:hypothetical protein
MKRMKRARETRGRAKRGSAGFVLRRAKATVMALAVGSAKVKPGGATA